MSTFYIKGGSRFNEANPMVWVGLFLGGYASGNYIDPNWKTIDYGSHISTLDPYWRLGGANGGVQKVEIGLYNHNKIRIDASGIYGWHQASGLWFSLYGGGGGVVGSLTDLSDVGNIAYTSGLVLKADGDDFNAGYLNWGDLANKPSEFAPSSHALTTASGVHFGSLPWSDLDKTGSSLADLATRAHANLSDAPTSAHHVRYADSEAVSAVEAEGTLDLSGILKIAGTTKTSAYLYAGSTDPTNTTRLNYDGYFYATRVYNAVYNDYADYWKAEVGVSKLPGYCYSLNKKGLRITSKRADKACIGICSDTYGHAVGSKQRAVPISIGGFLLAHVDEVYEAGDLLVPNEKGWLTKATKEEIIMQKAIAKYMFKETKIKTRGVWVNDRHWVKVL